MTDQQQQQPNPQDFHLTALDVPVPPMLEEALGYHGTILKHECNARYVGFYWGGGDEMMFDDGQLSSTGHWHAFLYYIQYPSIAEKLRPYDFGSSESEAIDYLVLDRQERKMYAGRANHAGNFLISQWSQPDVFDRDAIAAMDAPKWDALLNEIMDLTSWQRVPMSNEALTAAFNHQMQLEHDLCNWLQKSE